MSENGSDGVEKLGDITVRQDLRITVFFQPDGNPIVDAGGASPAQLLGAGELMAEIGRFQLRLALSATARQQQQQQIQIARLGSTKVM